MKCGFQRPHQQEAKLARGEELQETDWIDLILSPVMGGDLAIIDRITKGIEITKEYPTAHTQDIQAMMYLFATKFLDKEEVDTIKEMIKVTQLGKMLVEDGFKEGLEVGREEGFEEGFEEGHEEGYYEGKVELLHEMGLDRIQIARKLEISLGMVICIFERLKLE